MIGRFDLSGIQPSSLSASLEKTYLLDKSKIIKQLSEDDTLNSEQREKLIQEIVILQKESPHSIDLELSSKNIVQIKDELLQEEQRLKNHLEPSSEEFVSTDVVKESFETDNEDLFAEEGIDLTSEYNIEFNSENEAVNLENEALEQLTLEEEHQTSDISKQIYNQKTDISQKEDILTNAKEEIDIDNPTTQRINEVVHRNVEEERSSKEQTIVLSPQDCTKMLQNVDRTVKKLKEQNVHQTIARKQQTFRTEIKENGGLALGLGIEGLMIDKMKARIHGLLKDSKPIERKTESSSKKIGSDKNLSSILNTEHKRKVFQSEVQSLSNCFTTFLTNRNCDTKGNEQKIQQIAEQKLKKEVVNHGSVDLPEKNMRNVAKEFFFTVIEEGFVNGPDGQPLKLSPEEMKIWQKEFTESFISFLISHHLLEKKKEKEKSKVTPQSSFAQREEREKPINKEPILNIRETISAAPSINQDSIAQSQRNADQKKAEDAEDKQKLKVSLRNQKDLKDDIIQEDVKKHNVKREKLIEDRLKEERNSSNIKKQQMSLKQSEKTRVSKDPDELPISIIDHTKEKRPS